MDEAVGKSIKTADPGFKCLAKADGSHREGDWHGGLEGKASGEVLGERRPELTLRNCSEPCSGAQNTLP